MNVSPLLRTLQRAPDAARNLNCWSAAITKKHRKEYLRTYPTALVLPDGSSISIDYPVPRGIITLPLDLNTLSAEERKRRMDRRVKKTKIVLQDELVDDFDENRYLRLMKR